MTIYLASPNLYGEVKNGLIQKNKLDQKILKD